MQIILLEKVINLGVLGDVVRVESPRLGALVNEVTTSKAAPPWTFGIGDLMLNLARRGLLETPR